MKTENEVKKTITQNDVAREAGVTRSMVSYVINGSTDRSVAPETRQKILDAIDRLGYRPNKAAQALQQGDVAFASNRIGVILCDANVFLRPYYADILSGIHTAAHEHNYHVTFIRFFDELKNPVLFNQLIHQEEVGGLILVSTDNCIKDDSDKKIIDRIKERISRTVCVEWQHEGLSSVGFDRQETAKKACDYLFEKGYNDISYIGEQDDRVNGLKQSFIEHSKDVSSLVYESCFNITGGYDSASRMHKKQGKFSRAILCGSDEVAIGVMSYLNEQHFKIPEDVAVISIDNIEFSGFTTPPLTTMNVQKNAMGAKAVEMIVMNQAPQGKDSINISLPTELVVRQSC